MDRIIKKHYGFLKKTDRCFLLFAENDVESICLLERMSNRKYKPDAKVKIDVDLEDYYRIKDEEKRQESK